MQDIKYKLVNVGTAGILATNNEVERHAAEDDELGATELLKKTTEKITSDIKQQVSKDWQAGSTTRILFKGIELGDFMRSNINDVINKVRGVGSVDDRGTTGSGIAIEVKCFCSSGRLVKDILRKSFELDYILNPKELKGNSVYMDVKK